MANSGWWPCLFADTECRHEHCKPNPEPISGEAPHHKMDLVSGPHDEGISLPDPQELLEEAGGASTREQPPVEMYLCETERLFLKPNQLYRFVVHPTCERCDEISKLTDAARPVSGTAPQYTNRHGERCSEACGQGRHSECTETLATCNCTYRGLHKTTHRYATINPKSSGTEESAGRLTDIRDRYERSMSETAFTDAICAAYDLGKANAAAPILTPRPTVVHHPNCVTQASYSVGRPCDCGAGNLTQSPRCPKCKGTRIALAMLSFGRFRCPDCPEEFYVQTPADFAQFFSAGGGKMTYELHKLAFEVAEKAIYTYLSGVPSGGGSGPRLHKDKIRKAAKEIRPLLAAAASPQTPAPQEDALKCEDDCSRCSGEYCDKHITDPCDCDVLERHSSDWDKPDKSVPVAPGTSWLELIAQQIVKLSFEWEGSEIESRIDHEIANERFEEILAILSRSLEGRGGELDAYIKTLPAEWHEDSSLETWFPLTAEELKRKTGELDALRRERHEKVAEVQRGEAAAHEDMEGLHYRYNTGGVNTDDFSAGIEYRLCKFNVGQRVHWQGQEGDCQGIILEITHPENSGYVLKLDIGDGAEMYHLESDVELVEGREGDPGRLKEQIRRADLEIEAVNKELTAALARTEKLEAALRDIVLKARRRGWLVAQDSECAELVKKAEAALSAPVAQDVSQEVVDHNKYGPMRPKDVAQESTE